LGGGFLCGLHSWENSEACSCPRRPPRLDFHATRVTVSTAPESVADAAKKQKHHQACLELAKDNPSIVCK
jgi:hypothetical protein